MITTKQAWTTGQAPVNFSLAVTRGSRRTMALAGSKLLDKPHPNWKYEVAMVMGELHSPVGGGLLGERSSTLGGGLRGLERRFGHGSEYMS